MQIQKKGEHGLIVILLWDILRISNIVEVAKLSVSGNRVTDNLYQIE